MAAAAALPLKLAGPIVRRVSAREVHIWLLLSRPVAVRGRTLRGPASRDRYGEADVLGQSSLQPALTISGGLHVHILRIAPRSGTSYLDGNAVPYDIEIELSQGKWVSIVKNDEGCCLKGMHYPSVLIPSGRSLDYHVLYGSCRKLHSGGRDPLPATLAKIDARLLQRPHALFLGGDQLYADEVAQLLTGPLRRLANRLGGTAEPRLSMARGLVPQLGDSRVAMLKRQAGFSTGEGGNHLLYFWEFVAHYLVSFNAGFWPSAKELKDEAAGAKRRYETELGARSPWVDAGAGAGGAAALGLAAAKAQGMARAAARLDAELNALEESRAATVALSKLMANTSTLMMFDDHEVTDDWNLTQNWMSDVRDSPLGHRVIANALASFWIFQGYGNDPDRKDCPPPVTIVKTIDQYVAGKQGSLNAFVALMLDRMQWSFTFSQMPPVFCLDTRTRRAPADVKTLRTGINEESTASSNVTLVDKGQLDLLKSWLDSLDRSACPMIISPVPVFAFAILETVQQKISRQTEKLAQALDNEGWRSNPGNFYEFANALASFKGKAIVVLSGDLHFGFVREATLVMSTREIKVLQLTSSAIRNEAPEAVRKLLSWWPQNLALEREQTWWKPKEQTIAVLDTKATAADVEAFTKDYGQPAFKESSVAFDLRRPSAPGGVPGRSASLFANHLALLSFSRHGLTNTFILDPDSRERLVPVRWSW